MTLIFWGRWACAVLLVAAPQSLFAQPAAAPAPEPPATQAPAPQAPPATAASTTAPPPAEVQHVPAEEAVAVLGHRVTDTKGNDIGRLVDVIVDVTGAPRAAVLDIGGFMGLGNRKVAVDWKSLHFVPGEKDWQVTTDAALDQIKAAPEYRDPKKAAPIVTMSPPTAPPAPEPAPAPAPADATANPAAK